MKIEKRRTGDGITRFEGEFATYDAKSREDMEIFARELGSLVSDMRVGSRRAGHRAP